jgi:uncharacterized protein YbjQ (UPF0145 family)
MRRKCGWGAAIAAAAASIVASAAWAGTAFLDIPVSEARQAAKPGDLLELPFYMKGEPHPKVVRGLRDSTSERRVSGIGKPDRQTCHAAFLAALGALQQRAKATGGNAVVDVRSTTRHKDLSSRLDYRCATGGGVANVALTGRAVELESKAKKK